MESRHQIGLNSYDRFFPNQDTMPKGGFGNLIALPLQKSPRANGNSVFIDSEFRPYPNQWEFLASVKRMPTDAVEAVVLEAQKRGDVIGVRISNVDDEDIDPWMLPPSEARAEREIPGPFPARVQIVRSNLVYVGKDGLPPAMLNRLLRLAAFQNPEFYKAQAMRLPTFNKPRVIACGEDLANYIALPRGCIAEVVQLLETLHIKAVIRDERFAGQVNDCTQAIVLLGARKAEALLADKGYDADAIVEYVEAMEAKVATHPNAIANCNESTTKPSTNNGIVSSAAPVRMRQRAAGVEGIG